MNIVTMVDNNTKNTVKPDGIEIIQVKKYNQIYYLIKKFNNVFTPPLSKRSNNLSSYSRKLHKNAMVYVAKKKRRILGFIAFYINDFKTYTAYGTLIAVIPKAQNQNIGQLLVEMFINESKKRGMKRIKIEVDKHNEKAIYIYKKHGYKYLCDASDSSIYMIKDI